MPQAIDIHMRSARDGQIIFEDRPERLIATRLANGFRIKIPATIELGYSDQRNPQPMLNGLRADITVAQQDSLSFGPAFDYSFYVGGIPSNSATADLVWKGDIAEIQLIESIRRKGDLALRFFIKAEGTYILSQLGRNYGIRTDPVHIVGQVHVVYPQATWNQVVSDLKIYEPFLADVS